MNPQPQYQPGDLVQAIKPPCTFPEASVAGLYGYVSNVYTEKDGSITYMVILYYEKDKSEYTSYNFTGDALRPANSLHWGIFLKPLAAAELVEQAKPEDPNDISHKIMASEADPERKARNELDEAAIKELAEKTPHPFLSAEGIGRASKNRYRSLTTDEAQTIMDIPVRFGSSDRKLKDFTYEERLLWARANGIIRQFSYWPDDKLVRNLVEELDLDPYIDKFNRTLYGKKSYVEIPRDKLRATVISLLNDNEIILSIDPLKDNDRKNKNDEFCVGYTRRKKLPIA